MSPLSSSSAAPNWKNRLRQVPVNAFSSALPQLSDDAGTPYAVVVVPVDPALAVRETGANDER
jgi:hypothetical protein